MEKALWYLIAGTSGGANRVQIIRALSERPYNTNQLADRLDVCYNTVQHHLDMLEEYDVVTSGGEEYGQMYHLTDKFERYRGAFERIAEEATDSPDDSPDVTSNGW